MAAPAQFNRSSFGIDGADGRPICVVDSSYWQQSAGVLRFAPVVDAIGMRAQIAAERLEGMPRALTDAPRLFTVVTAHFGGPANL